jgi:threonine/homoserine/homoserine lactone efflux protein
MATESLLKGITFGLFMALSVGPTIFAILKYSISYGYPAGLSYIVGVSASDIMFVAIANLATSVLDNANEHQKAIGIIGSLVLIGMGLYGFFKKITPARNSSTIAPVGKSGLFKISISGFVMNTLNPGVIITWIAMSSAVLGHSFSYRGTVFITALAIVLGADVLKVLGANKIRQLLTPRNVIKLQRFAALCLLVTGLVLFIRFAFFNFTASSHV